MHHILHLRIHVITRSHEVGSFEDELGMYLLDTMAGWIM